MPASGNNSTGNLFYRCAGPNCGVLKGSSEHWWVMWTSMDAYKAPVLYLAPWSEELAQTEGALHVCGELCAQKLQSQFMGNVLNNILVRSGRRKPTTSSSDGQPDTQP
jgi:hypothetical protein